MAAILEREVALAVFRLVLIAHIAFVALAGVQAARAADPVIPFLDDWKASPHANVTREAFTHWDKVGHIPKACAKCHSGPGFLDFLGLDGSAPGRVDKDAPVHAAIDCVTCHNRETAGLAAVTMPSGLMIGNLGRSARCVLCHQGLRSGKDVEKALAGKAPDTVDPSLGFVNIHYRAAAATRWGTAAKGAYEYPGKDYAGVFPHPTIADECAECHDPHTLKVEERQCLLCHRASRSIAPLKKRVATLNAALLKQIRAYAAKAGKPIAYAEHTHPYFFADGNANGVVDTAEAAYDNRYQAWTPRLLRAAYNFQFVAKDPGAYAHNPDYALQALYDSLADLGGDVSGFSRP